MSKLTEKFIVEFDKAFKAATENSENFDKEGNINWDFVDADITMDLAEIFDEIPQELYDEEFDWSAQEWIEYNEAVYIAA
jgi:hypothetical protein